MTTLGSARGGKKERHTGVSVNAHKVVSALLIVALVSFVVLIVGGGLLYSLFSSKTFVLPEETTSTTSTTGTTVTSSTTSTSTSTTSTTSSTSTSSTTSTTESTTTTLSINQIAFCASRKVDLLYMRNDSVCFKCRSIRNYFGDSIGVFNIVDCEDNADQCRNELEVYRENNELRTPGGTVTGAIGYPAAVINNVAYVGVTASSIEELTGCGHFT